MAVGGDPDSGSAVVAAFVREGQKQEMRRERDHMLLELARAHGEAGLAERLGVTADVAARLLAGARERLAPRAATDGIGARRLAGAGDRWAEADAHFAALGR